MDSIGERFHELFAPLNPICNFKRLFTPEKKDEALKKTTAAIKQLEPLIEASGGPFCMGKEAHYADMHIYHHTTSRSCWTARS